MYVYINSKKEILVILKCVYYCWGRVQEQEHRGQLAPPAAPLAPTMLAYCLVIGINMNDLEMRDNRFAHAVHLFRC